MSAHTTDDVSVAPNVDGSHNAAADGVSHDEIHIEAGVGASRNVEAPSAESLIDCVHSGWMSKRGYKMGCLPTWKRRFFILKGQYLFKFSSPTVRMHTQVPGG